MRWFLRRLVFYVFAIWVALTLNFLLPRLMPGDPIGGVLQRLSPAQIQANPGIIQTYQALLGGGKGSIWHDYVVYLHRLAHLNFGISTSNYPAPVSEVIGRTLPYSIVLVGVAFLLAFVLGTDDRHDRRVAARRRRRHRRRADADGARRVPRLLHRAARRLLPRAEAAAGSRSSTPTTAGSCPGFNWAFLSSAVRHAELPMLVIIAAFTGGWVLNMRTVMINTISEDYVAMAHAKGLRDRRVMTRYAGRNAILPPLNGFAAQFAGAVGGLVFIEYVFSYPGAGLTLQQAALGNDYPLTQGLLLVFAFCVIAANFIMDLLNFVLDPRVRAELMSQLAAASSSRRRRRSASPRRRQAPPHPGLARAPARQPEVALRPRRSSASWSSSR